MSKRNKKNKRKARGIYWRWLLLAIPLALFFRFMGHIAATSAVPPETLAPATLQAPQWLVFSDREDFKDTDAEAIIRAATVWVAAYGPCPQPVTVLSMEAEQKEPEYISLDSTIPGEMNIAPVDTYFTALHSMTHACGGNDRPIIPVPYREGLIIGFRGLGIHVQLNNGEQTYFMKIEEGIAERNAICADSSYIPATPPYRRLSELSLKLLPCGDNTYVQYLKAADVRGFVAYLMGIPDDSVVMGDIASLMDAYMSAWYGP